MLSFDAESDEFIGVELPEDNESVGGIPHERIYRNMGRSPSDYILLRGHS